MIEKLFAVSERPDKHRKADKYELGTPDGNELESGEIESRDRLVLDDVIEKTIGKLPAAARLYPEVYAWRVSEAIIDYLSTDPEEVN